MSASPSIRLTEPDPNAAIQEPESGCPKIGYIDDSLVIEGECPETSVTPRVLFKYHPLSSGEYTEYLAKLDAVKHRPLKERERVVLEELIPRYVRGWDLRKPDGTAVSHTDIKELRRVPLSILDFIGNKITEASRDIDRLLGK